LALSARAISCNCGFELISEALCHSKRILASRRRQMEQVSNALALQALPRASRVRLDPR
jgi:hypothetical protein